MSEAIYATNVAHTGTADPFAGILEVVRSSDSAEDGASGNFYIHNFLNEGIEGHAKSVLAAGEDAGGVHVSINRPVISEAIFAGNLGRAAPAQELLLDFFAIGVMADRAFAAVAAHVWASFLLRGAGSY